MKIRIAATLLPLFSLAALGCPPKTQVKTDDAGSPQSLEATKVTPAQTDACTGKGTYDAGELADVGEAAFKAKDYEKSAACFGMLLDEFPKDERVPIGLFNLGLCEENLKQYPEAEGHFRRLIKEFPEDPGVPDARLRLGNALLKQERYEEAQKIFKLIAAPPDAPWFDKIEALTQVGVCYLMLKRYTVAEEYFWQAIHTYKRAERLDEYVDTYALAQIHFHRAGIKEALMLEAVLEAPKDDTLAERERVFKKLDEKCKWLLDAQYDFIRTIRMGHGHWATAAGYKIGALYEALFDAMVNTPKPEAFDAEEAQVYQEELKKKVAVLLKKSLVAFRKVCKVADRIRVQNEWVDKSRESLDRLEKLLTEVQEAGTPPPPKPPEDKPDEDEPETQPTASLQSNSRMIGPDRRRGEACLAPTAQWSTRYFFRE